MKKIIALVLLSSFILSFSPLESEKPKLWDYNGWEFLEWTWSKTQVEKELVKKNIKFDPGHPNQKQGPTTKFEYLGLETRLAYDSGHLYDIQQSKYFGSEEGELALSLLDDIKSLYTRNYGESKCEKDEEDENAKKIKWTAKHSEISLYFRHDPEAMEGFEDEAYIIYIQINEKR